MENAFLIPCSATFELQDMPCAYRVVDGKAVMTPLTVELTDDAKCYVVKGGLSEGDVIVTEGVGMIREGQEISVK